jgi:hypothetical protein
VKEGSQLSGTQMHLSRTNKILYSTENTAYRILSIQFSISFINNKRRVVEVLQNTNDKY